MCPTPASSRTPRTCPPSTALQSRRMFSTSQVSTVWQLKREKAGMPGGKPLRGRWRTPLVFRPIQPARLLQPLGLAQGQKQQPWSQGRVCAASAWQQCTTSLCRRRRRYFYASCTLHPANTPTQVIAMFSVGRFLHPALPGLSDTFIMLDDDFFLTAPWTLADLVGPDGGQVLTGKAC